MKIMNQQGRSSESHNGERK